MTGDSPHKPVDAAEAWGRFFLAVLLILFVGLPALFGFLFAMDHFGLFEVALPVLLVAVNIVLLIVYYPDYRRQDWFWVFLVAITALHGVGIALVDWSDFHWAKLECQLAGLADLALTTGLLHVTARIFHRSSTNGTKGED